MSTVIITLLIVIWIVGPVRGLVGGLVGGMFGVAVATGMTRMATAGDFAAHYTPATLAKSAATIGIVAAALAFAAPFATRIAALGWAIGALLAAIAVPRTGQTAYLLPLALHLLAAVLVLRMARRSVRQT